jgi:16S rRNA (guanine966-N2)-methyltransferase
MRVISGAAKGIQLASVPGNTTRPITDRVKEALFNIIGLDVVGKTFLDLFGGTGAVGIEALSRGAEYAFFLDTSYRACRVIRQNLKTTNFQEFADVQKMDAFIFLRSQPLQVFDYIYIAPPQYKSLWHKILMELDQNPDWLDKFGVAVVQIHPKEFDASLAYANFIEFDRRVYGDTLLIFYEKILPK